MSETTIKIPDIGGATGVDVIEILVKVGDVIVKDTPLVTLETDKASMEIPSPLEGKIAAIALKVGDKVAEGDAIAIIAIEDNSVSTSLGSSEGSIDSSSKLDDAENNSSVEIAKKPETALFELKDIVIPDIGTTSAVDIIEVMVKVGDEVSVDSPLITLEGDKATMEIPCLYEGTIAQVYVKVGDKISQGDKILQINAKSTLDKLTPTVASPALQEAMPEAVKAPQALPEPAAASSQNFGLAHASPGIRRMARELGVDLSKVKGTGRKGRIAKEDVNAFVKAALSQQNQGGFGFNLSKAPVIDFAKFGNIEIKPLNKIKKITGMHTHRSWLSIPHVTQFDEADITTLEQFRKDESAQGEKEGYKLTILAFVCKAVAKALSVYPQFNASLDDSGENLVLKQYVNIGIAVETPNGLVVPVIRDVDKISVSDIAKEMARLSTKARDKGLMPQDMSGGCFTISSLGGIGGTAFTPIVNSPEVAILGLSRSSMKPVFEQGIFVPRLMLPLSLSYDHRVIDGAEAARFTRYLADSLQDVRKILL